MPISRNSNETREFIACLGKTPEDYEKMYGVNVVIQGSSIEGDNMEENSTISIYAEIRPTYNPPYVGEATERIEVPKEYKGEMDNRCTDLHKPLNPTIIKQYNSWDNHGNNHIIAVVDSLRNIFFMDFYHQNGSAFTMFEWILNDHYNSNPREHYLSIFEKNIKSIDANKVEKVIIKTEFDIDHFVSEGKKKIERTIRTQQAIAKSQVESIKRTLTQERLTIKTRMEESNKQSFLEGIKSVKSGWVVKDNRLVYNKSIPMKTFTTGHKNISAPEGKYFTKGLNITISPTVSTANAHKDSYHPNISESNNVCIGDLQGKSLKEFMDKIEKQMEVGNLASPFNSRIANEGHKLFDTDLNNIAESEKENTEYEAEHSKSLVWNL